jgi:hypothetical protein
MSGPRLLQAGTQRRGYRHMRRNNNFNACPARRKNFARPVKRAGRLGVHSAQTAQRDGKVTHGSRLPSVTE